MKVCLVKVGHHRTYSYTKKNHEANLFPVSYIHHRNEDSASFNYYTQTEHPYDSRRNADTVVRNVLNMWHNRYLAFATAPEGYDVYVIMRYDITISDLINFEDYEYDDFILYIPSDNDHGQGVNDQMAFGNREAVKKYVSIHTNHLHLFNTIDHNWYSYFHPETYTTRNLVNQNVNIVRVPQKTQIVYDDKDLPLHVMMSRKDPLSPSYKNIHVIDHIDVSDNFAKLNV